MEISRVGKSVLRSIVWAIALSVAAALNYLAWLGWDQQKDVSPDGTVSGPYEAWQVVGLGAGIAALSIFAGWRKQPIVATIIVPFTSAICFSVDSATDEDSDGLWVVGAFMILIAGLIGVGLASTITYLISRFRQKI